MITIRNYSNMAEAGFAKSLLESVGILAFLPDEITATLERPIFPLGIRLQVPPSDVERALEVLDSDAEFAPLPEDFEPPELGVEPER